MQKRVRYRAPMERTIPSRRQLRSRATSESCWDTRGAGAAEWSRTIGTSSRARKTGRARKLRRWMRAGNQAGRGPSACVCATSGTEGSGPRSQMNTMRQPKQGRSVVEHKGKYPRLGSTAFIPVRAQSLTWDTLFAAGSRIGPAAVYPQLIQELAWDTLSRLKTSHKIAGILMTSWFARAIRPLGRRWQDISRIRRKSYRGRPRTRRCEKNLSRTPFLVAYRVEGLEMRNATVHRDVDCPWRRVWLYTLRRPGQSRVSALCQGAVRGGSGQSGRATKRNRPKQDITNRNTFPTAQQYATDRNKRQQREGALTAKKPVVEHKEIVEHGGAAWH